MSGAVTLKLSRLRKRHNSSPVEVVQLRTIPRAALAAVGLRGQWCQWATDYPASLDSLPGHLSFKRSLSVSGATSFQIWRWNKNKKPNGSSSLNTVIPCFLDAN